MKDYKNHPASELFPMMAEQELTDLASDIKANGLREPITLFTDMILDGRNRYLACKRVGVKMRFDPYTGDNPIAYALSKNLHRRHLNASQRGIIAARAKDLYADEAKRRQEEGGREGALITHVKLGRKDALASYDANPTPSVKPISTQNKGKALAQAAQALGVGATTVERAAVVIERAPHLVPLIESGALLVNTAYDSLPKPARDLGPKLVREGRVPKFSDRRLAAANHRIDKLLGSLIGWCDYLEGSDTRLLVDACQKRHTELTRDLKKVVKTLEKFILSLGAKTA